MNTIAYIIATTIAISTLLLCISLLLSAVLPDKWIENLFGALSCLVPVLFIAIPICILWACIINYLDYGLMGAFITAVSGLIYCLLTFAIPRAALSGAFGDSFLNILIAIFIPFILLGLPFAWVFLLNISLNTPLVSIIFLIILCLFCIHFGVYVLLDALFFENCTGGPEGFILACIGFIGTITTCIYSYQKLGPNITFIISSISTVLIIIFLITLYLRKLKRKKAILNNKAKEIK